MIFSVASNLRSNVLAFIDFYFLNPLDELFGERVELEIPGPGGITKRSVTKKWLAQMQAEGKIAKVANRPLIQVHMLHLMHGYRVETWEIGKDVSADIVERFRDAEKHALYAITLSKSGEPERHVIPKSAWEDLKAQYFD